MSPPPYCPAVILRGCNGTVVRYPSRAAALEALGLAWIRAYVGPHFRYFDPVVEDWREHAWTLHDETGRTLLAEDFVVYRNRPSWWLRRYGNYPGFGPVPHTGRRYGGHLFRRPHTTQERRRAPVFDDLDPGPRAKRGSRLLPNAWDDFRLQCLDNRNWKRFRRTQWKG